jgi:menaquinol-cytochrome c reductase iron-sulfur subunit
MEPEDKGLIEGKSIEEQAHVDGNSPDQQELMTRRQFLTKLSLALGGVGTAIVGLPIVGFLFAPLFNKPPEIWRPVGPVDQFKIGETVEVSFLDASPLPWAGVAAQTAAWLRRDSEQDFTVFSVHCTHLGCPVNWIPDGKLFLCPCHGGVYYQDGSVAAGPPPKSLPRYPVRVLNGQVEIQTTGVPIQS